MKRTSKAHARGRFTKKFYVSRRRMPKMRAFFSCMVCAAVGGNADYNGVMEKCEESGRVAAWQPLSSR